MARYVAGEQRYLELLGGGFLDFEEEERASFVASLQADSLQASHQEIGALFGYEWRARLTAAWLVGVAKRVEWRECGTCGRAFSTPCIHEHVTATRKTRLPCLRGPMDLGLLLGPEPVILGIEWRTVEGNVVGMSSVAQQLPALIGVLLGATATYVVTAAAERARWKRAQSVRWDEKRLTAYTEYAHSLKKAIILAVRIAAYRGIHPDVDKISPAEGIPALATAEEERTMKWEAVLLLGSEDAVVAGRKWHESMFRLQRIAIGEAPDESWTEAIKATSGARREFYEVARRDIGLAIRGSAQSYEWQVSKLLRSPGEHAGTNN